MLSIPTLLSLILTVVMLAEYEMSARMISIVHAIALPFDAFLYSLANLEWSLA